MAQYKDPEERLEDIEDMVKSIKRSIDSMQRRSTIMTIFRSLRWVIMIGVILWVYYGLQPFISQLGQVSASVGNNVEVFNESISKVQDFFSVNEKEVGEE